MPFRQIVLIAIATSLLAAPMAQAREARLALDQTIGGNSNLVQGTRSRVPDGFYEIRPSLRVRENREKLNYDFWYGPQYNAYFKTDGINGWNHYLNGNLNYVITPRDSVSLTSSARLERFISTDQELAPTAPDLVAPGLGDVGRYRVGLDYTRSISQRLSSVVGGAYEQWTYSNPFNSPNISGQGHVDANYVLHPRLSIGGNLQGTYRAFEEVGPSPAANSTIIATNALFTWQALQTFTVSASGGPAWLRRRQDDPEDRLVSRYSFRFDQFGQAYAAPWARGGDPPGANCPLIGSLQLLTGCDVDTDPTTGDLATGLGASVIEQVPRGFVPGEDTTSQDSDSVTFFAMLSLEKAWGPRWSTNLKYERNQDASGGLSSTRISDTVTAIVRHSPTELLKLSASAAFSNRFADSNQTLGLALARADSGGNTTDNGDLLAEAGDLVVVRFNQRIETKQLYMNVSAAQKLTEHLSIRGQFTYLDQWTDSRLDQTASGGTTSSSSSRFTRFVGRLVLRYEFDPYRF